MAKAIQLSISCENRPGTLAHLCRTLGDKKVNILALQAGTLGTEGRVQVVVDDVNKARKALDAAGMNYTEETVLHLELPNVPGALANLAGKLAAKEINIASACATASKGSRKASVVLAVSDLEKASRIR